MACGFVTSKLFLRAAHEPFNITAESEDEGTKLETNQA
jgi:hypothetical protein